MNEMEDLFLRLNTRVAAQERVLKILLAIVANSERPMLEANLRAYRLRLQEARLAGASDAGASDNVALGELVIGLLESGLAPATEGRAPGVRTT